MTESWVPEYRPTWAEWQDFNAYVAKIEPEASRVGMCKIIPPEEFRPRQGPYETAMASMTIGCPVRQLSTSERTGAFELGCLERKSLSVPQFRAEAEAVDAQRSKREAKSLEDGDLEALERAYWSNITFSMPTYGADTPGTLFDRECTVWNVSRLPSILNVIGSVPGVTTPYLYFGQWKATFAWHVEDMNLHSINFLHLGHPKQWYCVPPAYAERFERLAQSHFPAKAKACAEFLRHKNVMISPKVLARNSIPVLRAVQRAREFIITFPRSYHCGFNYGFNVAESTNFATERWIEAGRMARHCTCGAMANPVNINMDSFVALLRERHGRPMTPPMLSSSNGAGAGAAAATTTGATAAAAGAPVGAAASSPGAPSQPVLPLLVAPSPGDSLPASAPRYATPSFDASQFLAASFLEGADGDAATESALLRGGAEGGGGELLGAMHDAGGDDAANPFSLAASSALFMSPQLPHSPSPSPLLDPLSMPPLQFGAGSAAASGAGAGAAASASHLDYAAAAPSIGLTLNDMPSPSLGAAAPLALQPAASPTNGARKPVQVRRGSFNSGDSMAKINATIQKLTLIAQQRADGVIPAPQSSPSSANSRKRKSKTFDAPAALSTAAAGDGDAGDDADASPDALPAGSPPSGRAQQLVAGSPSARKKARRPSAPADSGASSPPLSGGVPARVHAQAPMRAAAGAAGAAAAAPPFGFSGVFTHHEVALASMTGSAGSSGTASAGGSSADGEDALHLGGAGAGGMKGRSDVFVGSPHMGVAASFDMAQRRGGAPSHFALGPPSQPLPPLLGDIDGDVGDTMLSMLDFVAQNHGVGPMRLHVHEAPPSLLGVHEHESLSGSSESSSLAYGRPVSAAAARVPSLAAPGAAAAAASAASAAAAPAPGALADPRMRDEP